MTAEDLLIDDGGNRQTIEAVCESLPQFNVESAFALIVEAVDAVDGSTLVVAPQQEEILWVFDLVGQQQADGLKRLLPSVYVVPQKQVVGFRGEASILKQSQ